MVTTQHPNITHSQYVTELYERNDQYDRRYANSIEMFKADAVASSLKRLEVVEGTGVKVHSQLID